MLGAEAFTILAVLEARDRASAVVANVDRSLNDFTASALRASEAAQTAGGLIDESLLATASGADAVDVSTARLTAARNRLTLATAEAARAEQALMDATASVGAGGVTTADIMERQVTAATALTAAQRELGLATRGVATAEELQTRTARTAAATTDELAAASAAAAASQRTLAGSSATAEASMASMRRGAATVGLGLAVAGAVMVHAAGNFESSTEHLVTDAGETQNKLGMVRQGILDIAKATGTSAMDLSNAMYHVESAGYHAGEGIDVLRTAAEGAKVGNADFATVAKTLTGTLNSYGLAGSDANSMMNQLIATTAAGDLRMQDLTTALSSVVPVAAAVKLSYAEVGGAISIMTAQNMTAHQATQNLGNTIRALENPTAQATQEMKGLGLSSQDVSKGLSRRGLTGTLEMLTTAIMKNTKGGDVLMATMKGSKNAVADANIMMKELPTSLQKMAKGLLDGSVTAKEWNAQIIKLGPVQQNMGRQFLATVKHAGDFNQLLRSGSPAAQTYTAALSKMLGGATGLNTALMLSGSRMGEFKNNVHKIAESAKEGGDHVANWSKIQGTFNQKMDVLKATVGAAGIEIGTVLLPAASKIVSAFSAAIGPMADFIGKHQRLVGLVASVAGGMLLAAGAIKAVAIATKLWAIAQGLMNTLMAIFDAELALTGIPELIILIAGLVAGVIYAWMHFKTFRTVVMTVFNAVKTAVMTAVDAVVTAFHWLVDITMFTWHSLVGAWNAVASAARTVWNAIVTAWDAVASVTSTVWNAISGFFAKWWPLLLVLFATPIAILIAAWNHFHEAAFSMAKTAWNAIKSFFVGTWHAIEATAKVAWMLIKATIIAPMMLVWKGIVSVWNAIAPYLSSVWGGMRSVAASMWNQIKSAIINPLISAWHLVVNYGGKILSGMKTSLMNTLSMAKDVASKFLSVGKDIVMGMVHGIESGASSVASAAKNVAESALKSAKSFLGISSPSKKFKELGAWVVHGLVDGLTGSMATVKSATNRLARTLMIDFGDSHRALQRYVGREDAELRGLAARRDKYTKEITAANKKLSDLKSAWKQERDSIAQSIAQGASVVLAAPAEGVQYTSKDVVSNMETQLRKAKTFADELMVLKKKGLRSDLIAQIAAAGVDQGGATAAALSTASKATINKLNTMQKDLVKTSNQAGGTVADSMYKAGIKSAEGLVKGLKDRRKDIEDEMLAIAKAMQKAIKKALGIKSPSSVFADEVGKFIPQGIAKGVADHSSVAERAIERMSGTLVAAATGTQRRAEGAAYQGLRSIGGTQGGGGNLIIDLRGSQVMSDADMDKLVNKIGSRVATRVLPAGGTRIRM